MSQSLPVELYRVRRFDAMGVMDVENSVSHLFIA